MDQTTEQRLRIVLKTAKRFQEELVRSKGRDDRASALIIRSYNGLVHAATEAIEAGYCATDQSGNIYAKMLKNLFVDEPIDKSSVVIDEAPIVDEPIDGSSVAIDLAGIDAAIDAARVAGIDAAINDVPGGINESFRREMRLKQARQRAIDSQRSKLPPLPRRLIPTTNDLLALNTQLIGLIEGLLPVNIRTQGAANASRFISQDVRDAVWRRDQGRCVQCGTNEFLEFDHIVPFSKGGSNTARNIQLLCEKCNREKLNFIG